MASYLTMTSKIHSLKQHLKKMPFLSHLWFSLFFIICFSSQSVLSIPLDQMSVENPSKTEHQNPNQGSKFSRLYVKIHPRNQQMFSKLNSGSLQSSASQPNQKFPHLNFTPTTSFIEQKEFERERRNSGSSLSIVNPLDVLRQRLLIEIERRRLHSQNSQQINANTEFLKTIG